MEELKIGDYGLKESTEGMYARTTNGIIGKIINANSEEMINGPEIKSNGKIFCVERNSIKEIKENILDLIKNKDILKLKDLGDESIMYFGFDENAIEIKYKEVIDMINDNEIELLQILTNEQFEMTAYEIDFNK